MRDSIILIGVMAIGYGLVALIMWYAIRRVRDDE